MAGQAEPREVETDQHGCTTAGESNAVQHKKRRVQTTKKKQAQGDAMRERIKMSTSSVGILFMIPFAKSPYPKRKHLALCPILPFISLLLFPQIHRHLQLKPSLPHASFLHRHTTKGGKGKRGEKRKDQQPHVAPLNATPTSDYNIDHEEFPGISHG